MSCVLAGRQAAGAAMVASNVRNQKPQSEDLNVATQMYIIERENKIIEAVKAARELTAAAELERKSGGNGFVSRDNRDCWGTVGINANAAIREMTKLAIAARV